MSGTCTWVQDCCPVHNQMSVLKVSTWRTCTSVLSQAIKAKSQFNEAFVPIALKQEEIGTVTGNCGCSQDYIRICTKTWRHSCFSIQTFMKAQNLHKPAKNVIFMMGDGMGVSTLTAARVYLAQTRNLTGTDVALAWEHMPHTALLKVSKIIIVGQSKLVWLVINI